MKRCTKTVYFVTNVYACVYPRVRAREMSAYVCVCVCVLRGDVYMVMLLYVRFSFFKLTGKCLRLDSGGLRSRHIVGSRPLDSPFRGQSSPRFLPSIQYQTLATLAWRYAAFFRATVLSKFVTRALSRSRSLPYHWLYKSDPSAIIWHSTALLLMHRSRVLHRANLQPGQRLSQRRQFNKIMALKVKHL